MLLYILLFHYLNGQLMKSLPMTNYVPETVNCSQKNTYWRTSGWLIKWINHYLNLPPCIIIYHFFYFSEDGEVFIYSTKIYYVCTTFQVISKGLGIKECAKYTHCFAGLYGVHTSRLVILTSQSIRREDKSILANEALCRKGRLKEYLNGEQVTARWRKDMWLEVKMTPSRRKGICQCLEARDTMWQCWAEIKGY